MPWPAVWTASWRTSGPPGSRPWPGGADGEVELDIEVAGSIAPAANIADGARSAFEAALRIGRRSGSNWHLAGAILGLACLAGDAGDWEWAATLAQALGTGPASRGKKTRRVSAGTAWTKRVRTWAMSSWSGPTLTAWRSAARRPST